MKGCSPLSISAIFLGIACAAPTTPPLGSEPLAVAASNERTRCESDAAILASPQRLWRLGEEAERTRQRELAYCYFSLLRTLHAESAEARQAFVPAARAFKPLYNRDRHRNPSSRWVTGEADFLFAWLEGALAGDSFPQAEMDAILRGMPVPFGERLRAYLAERPALARWRFETPDDNGVIQAVRSLPDSTEH